MLFLSCPPDKSPRQERKNLPACTIGKNKGMHSPVGLRSKAWPLTFHVCTCTQFLELHNSQQSTEMIKDFDEFCLEFRGDNDFFV